MKRKLLLVAVLVLALGALSGGIAIAAGGDGDDAALTGDTLAQATKAALAHAGGGTVTEAEAGDDGAAYDVEVRRADGSRVEVRLDARFGLIGRDADDDGAGGEEEGTSDANGSR